MKEMKISEIIKAVDGNFIGDSRFLGTKIKGITANSREVEDGFLFIPIIGERFDGHDFIEDAYKNGAVCVLSQNNLENRTYIKTESTFKALKDIAEYYRSLFDVKVIGITGSVGKTTTKEMIYSVLSQKYNVLKAKGNFNNEIGVPLTLFNLEEKHDFAIIEMGMNHSGEISRLSKTARPNVCVIVNIDYTHIGHLGSREGVFKAKTEIFDYAKKDCISYLNGDDDMLFTLKENDLNTVFYGFDTHNDVLALDIVSKGLQGIDCKIKSDNQFIDIHINKPGKHLIYSALAATAIAQDFGLNNEQIRAGISAFEPADNRMDIIKSDKITILNDVYNASPASVRAALDVLCCVEGRKVCILGDMLELGEYAAMLHKEIGEYAAQKGIDLIICAGKLSQNINDGAIQKDANAFWFESQDKMIVSLSELIKEGDTILVKASRGMKFEKTVEKLKIL